MTRSEVVTADGSAPSPLRQTRVHLRVWGFMKADAVQAELAARQVPGSKWWEVVEVIPSSEAVCPIPPHDPVAINQGTDYDWAWAVYPAGLRGDQ